MNNRSNVRTLAVSTLLVLASLGTNVYADSVIEVDNALAAQVQQQIHLKGSSASHPLNNIRVQAKNGVLRIDGFIEGLEARRAVNEVLKSVEGLHLAQIDDHLVQQ